MIRWNDRFYPILAYQFSYSWLTIWLDNLMLLSSTLMRQLHGRARKEEALRGITSDLHWCFVFKCQRKPEETWGKKRPLLFFGCRVHQCSIVLRNPGRICNVTANRGHLPPVGMNVADSWQSFFIFWHENTCTEHFCVLHMLNFFIDCVLINRGEAGGDKRWTKAAYTGARGHVWRAGSPL